MQMEPSIRLSACQVPLFLKKIPVWLNIRQSWYPNYLIFITPAWSSSYAFSTWLYIKKWTAFINLIKILLGNFKS
jgi:hypothetical protein